MWAQIFNWICSIDYTIVPTTAPSVYTPNFTPISISIADFENYKNFSLGRGMRTISRSVVVINEILTTNIDFNPNLFTDSELFVLSKLCCKLMYQVNLLGPNSYDAHYACSQFVKTHKLCSNWSPFDIADGDKRYLWTPTSWATAFTNMWFFEILRSQNIIIDIPLNYNFVEMEAYNLNCYKFLGPDSVYKVKAPTFFLYKENMHFIDNIVESKDFWKFPITLESLVFML